MRKRNQLHIKENSVHKFDRNDPFNILHSMLGFGSFFGNMISLDDIFYEQIPDFSQIQKYDHKRGLEGSFVTQNFFRKIEIGPDGKEYTEDYMEKKVNHNKAGNKSMHKIQAYNNSEGYSKIGEKKILNNRGRQFIKQRKGDSIEQYKQYYNIGEEELEKFEEQWEQQGNRNSYEQQQLRKRPIGYQQNNRERSRDKYQLKRLNEEELQKDPFKSRNLKKFRKNKNKMYKGKYHRFFVNE